MDTSYDELLHACLYVIDSYKQSLLSTEDHWNTYTEKFQHLTDSSLVFIQEVFFGCVRFEKITRVVVDGFFMKDGKNVSKSDESLYRAISYLALFRLEELEINNFEEIVKSLNVNNMFKFLNFFFNENHLKTWMKDEWMKAYDINFVQMNLLLPIMRQLPVLKQIVKELKKKLDNKIKPKKPQIKSTETKPFNLTQCQARSVPIPEPIPKLESRKEVPKSTWLEPKEMFLLNKAKEENRSKSESILIEANEKSFSCASAEKTSKTKDRMNSIVSEEISKLDFNKHKANPLPTKYYVDNVPIKLNTAAMLREDNLYKRRETDLISKIEHLESGGKDPSEFFEWQKKMRDADLQKDLENIEKKILEGKCSLADAVLAKHDLINQNQIIVDKMKKESDDRMKEYLKMKVKEEEEMRNIVQQVIECHENAKESMKKLKEYKAKLVQDMTEEGKELARRAMEEAEEEMKQRIELIKQIRAMESIPINRNKQVDFTETPGFGFLNEMSIAELNERLSIMKIEKEHEQKTRREQIILDKKEKDEILLESLERISRHRRVRSQQAAIRSENKRKQNSPQTKIKTEELLELEKSLEEKRLLMKRLKSSSKSKTPIRKREINQNASQDKQWDELERSQLQSAKLLAQRYANNIPDMNTLIISR